MNLTGYSATQLYYRPQTKFAKVRFLHLSVGHSVPRGICIGEGGFAFRGGGGRGSSASIGGLHPEEGSASRGVCIWRARCASLPGIDTPPRQTPTGRHRPPLGRHPSGRHLWQTPHKAGGHYSGRYASYWNAFLFPN